MEYLTTVINKVIDNFDFNFMIIINVLTYLLIKTMDELNGIKIVNTWTKRIILMLCTVLIGIIYKISGYNNDIVIINSAILTPVFWDWILRPIFKKFGIGYKQIDDCLH